MNCVSKVSTINHAGVDKANFYESLASLHQQLHLIDEGIPELFESERPYVTFQQYKNPPQTRLQNRANTIDALPNVKIIRRNGVI